MGTYAGLRPLVAPSDAASSVKVSREHRVGRRGAGPGPGQRRQVHDLPGDGPRRGRRRAGPRGAGPGRARRRSCRSSAPRRARSWTRWPTRLAREAGHRRGRPRRRWWTATGPRPPTCWRSARDATWSAPLLDGHPFLEAEVAWAVEHELAMTLDDLLARRLRLAPSLRDRGEAIAPRVAADRRARPGLGCRAPGGRGHEPTSRGAHREFDVPRRGLTLEAPDRRRNGCAKRYRHGCDLTRRLSLRGRPRACSFSFARSTLGLLRTRTSTLEDPGKRRRQLEEIGTWPTRP